MDYSAPMTDRQTPTAKQKPTAKPKAKNKPKPKAAKIKPLDRASVQELFSRFRIANPEPKGELEHVNAFTLLVAVVLSAQATDSGVNKATRALFAMADTPQKMLALGEDAVREHVRTIGLFRTKAKNVMALSQLLIARHGGEVPAIREQLEALPGVGRKTANVVLNMAFGQITHAVDTHVFRVANRLRIAPGKTPLAVEAGLEKAVPAEFGHHAHHWLILHGRYTCKARAPECGSCIVADLCQSPDKRVARAPN
jgi:endonuclease III